MPFEINSVQQTQAQPSNTPEGARVAAARTEPAKAEQETGKSSLSETVSFTDTAAKLQSMQNTVESQPVVDSQRVEAVRSAIENGSYEIDNGRIADKLMSLEAGLV
jgi:negative regulator of flagellin synthesis FlgM